jgi:uncharacterized protein (DUF924 family)
MVPAAQSVLDFWFGPVDDPGHALSRPQWFRKDAAFDAQIVQRFGALIEQALEDGLDDWCAPPIAPLPTLASVIVLDQFTRNAFRGTARAFAGDPMALLAASALVDRGLDRELTGVQRQFAYLPFEHAENRALQCRSVELFAQLGRDEPTLAGLLEWAQRHRDIIERFGRFPHRNVLLGRSSTVEEIEFLKQPGSGF